MNSSGTGCCISPGIYALVPNDNRDLDTDSADAARFCEKNNSCNGFDQPGCHSSSSNCSSTDNQCRSLIRKPMILYRILNVENQGFLIRFLHYP